MYNILIADDEQLERMVLQHALEEHLGGNCVIQSAANGREDVQLAEKMRADLIFMDIEMPGINGLEASKLILNQLPNCKVIMLTAYSKFEYARESVSFGAFEYLLKPCSNEELFQVLDRTLEEINRVRNRIRAVRETAQKIEKLTGNLEEQLILLIIGDFVSPQHIRNKLEEMSIAFQNGVFVILDFRGGMQAVDVRAAVDSQPWPKGFHLFHYEYDGRLCMLCTSSDAGCSSGTEVQQRLRALFDRETPLGKVLKGAVSNEFYKLEDAQNEFYQAQIALSGSKEEIPLVCLSNNPYLDLYPLSGSVEESIVRSVLVNDTEIIRHVIEGIVESLLAQRFEYEVIWELLELKFHNVIQQLDQQNGIHNIFKRITPSQYKPRENTAAAFKAALVAMLGRIAREVEANQKDHVAQMRQEIAGYIQANYHRDIFLQTVAHEMNYSDTYFSKLFKQCFQQNFISYLTQVRMEAAKELFLENKLTVKEVGERVGYSDPNYFTKVFRKATGQTPSEYRHKLFQTVR